ncbi:probable E3 ubiquitin-protein ligase ATL44 [Triticum dicoccoides]|uniref:probable E3 ubiquitin-protein ligase ATL44 n=1 Tax=Triticum dicoccoides TaxID=85692 RepID=UPI000E7C3E9A|nr:probable E3 ubiquitin-protein ligase ATL44 [Triticum dicoccoides]
MSNCMDVSATPSPEPPPPTAALDYDAAVILAVMLCALVCALGLNSVLQQCVARCARRAVADPAGWVAHRRANAGLKREALVALPVATYAGEKKQQQQHASASGAGCAICLSDFADGETIRVLPVCGHRFHVLCVDRWLTSRCSCPTCRRRLSPDRADAGEGQHRRELQVLNAV